MKKKKVDLLKYDEVLSTNRLSVSSDFKNLFIKDLSNLILEYFETRDTPFLDIVKEGNSLNIVISFSSNGLKQFKIINQ